MSRFHISMNYFTDAAVVFISIERGGEPSTWNDGTTGVMAIWGISKCFTA